MASDVASALDMAGDLVGVHELSEMFGVTKRTIFNYVARDDFPEPIERLASGPIWRRADVEKWATATLPLPTGRPPRDAG